MISYRHVRHVLSYVL